MFQAVVSPSNTSALRWKCAGFYNLCSIKISLFLQQQKGQEMFKLILQNEPEWLKRVQQRVPLWGGFSLSPPLCEALMASDTRIKGSKRAVTIVSSFLFSSSRHWPDGWPG